MHANGTNVATELSEIVPGGPPPGKDPGLLLERAIGQARELQLRYQNLFDFAPDGYLVTDLRGIILAANHAVATLLNRDRHFLLGKPLAFLFDRAGRNAVYRWLTRFAVEDWDPVPCEFRTATGRHACQNVQVSASRVPGAADEPDRLRWLLRDASQARLTNGTLQRQKQLADCLVDAVEEFILVVDLRGLIVRCNPSSRSVTGYLENELLNADWTDVLLAAESRTAGRQFLRSVATSGSGRSDELALELRDGSRRLTTWSARVFQADDRDLIALVGHDVTNLRADQYRALEAERLAAVAHTIGALAHESRNALQRSQSCLTLLELRSQGNPEVLDLLVRLQEAQNDLQRLFDDVRGFASPMALERQVCDIATVWRNAWHDLVQAREKRQTALVELGIGIERWCLIDPYRIKQIFRNLFENALSAAVDPVTITIRCADVDLDGRAALQVVVRDSGPGFSDEQRKRAFEPFYTTKARGTGFGLAICRRIVEAHGGWIDIGSGPPGGEVVVTLPRSDE
jgi:PAS domain S-box-containing protein